jgi:hypothetical protein
MAMYLYRLKGKDQEKWLDVVFAQEKESMMNRITQHQLDLAAIAKTKLNNAVPDILASVSPDKQERIKNTLNNLNMCLSGIIELDSLRDLHINLPRLVKDFDSRCGNVTSLPEEFHQLLDSLQRE